MSPAPPGVKTPLRASTIPYQFAAQPVGVRESFGLTPTELLVFTALLDDAKLRGWRSRKCNNALASAIGRTTMTVKRCLARLEGLGLILREFVREGRVRTGIRITWAGVEHARFAERTHLEHQRSGGGTSASPDVEHRGSTNQNLSQDETSDGGISPSIGEDRDPALRVAEGPEAAAFLRACIEAGRRGLPQPTPPGFAHAKVALPAVPTPPAPQRTVDVRKITGSPTVRPPALPSRSPQEATKREIEAMVGSLAFGFATGLRRPYRVGQQLLATQLAEVRRKPGRR